ncbi:uncharacterized protein LOC143039997 [Oratosquilla oratoria]|uniref:uncharacterized protein LOC143039997 n=1 Tax=Oratosquilla oratoria TaxID=337810 RepID=UPI003F75CE85
MHYKDKLILIAALVASAAAVPTGTRSSCASHCQDTSRFDYKNGLSYVYEYSTETTTSLLGTLEENSRILIKSKAQIDVIAPCEYILRLSDVDLDGSPRASEFADALTRVPLGFSFQNGVVENVCGEEEEPSWVLNFKRGVLSTFQNSMTKPEFKVVEETDIIGKCKTEYVATQEGTATFYSKTKDFDSCTHRSGHTSNLATIYMTNSPIQSLPIMRSEQKCNQKHEEGILKETVCEETHQYRPFSNHMNGVVTKIVSRLDFISIGKASLVGTDYIPQRSTLLFDASKFHKTHNEVDKAINILEQLDSLSKDHIDPQVPTLFYELVATLKGLTYSQLTTLFTNAKGSNKHKFLVDAVPLLTTPASVKIIRDLIKNGFISEKDADVWFTSLALVKNPTPAFFDALATMETTPSKQAMLGISALINNYCKTNTACDKEAGINKILRQIENQIGATCHASTETEKERIVVALKALGNAGRWVNAASVLKRCYTEDNDMEIRVAALEAWRHAPCHYDRSHLMSVFIDVQQDSEIRIASYLALMTCPNKEVIDIVKDRLNSEAINQVSSFVWTHMTNLYESAAPGKLWMHDLIGQDFLKHKFNTSALKFSRNFESSFFMNEINTGATVESNVIFSGKSFLPRSAMLNLTMDLFGESINFFEIGGRFEGFEAYLERFFGPDGYYPEETVAAILKNLRQEKNKEQTSNLATIIEEATDEPSGSLYLRLFGNEMYYKHFHGLADLFKSSDYSNPMDLLTDLVRKGNVDYLKSFSIIDTEFSLSSISGLPITLKLNGTATVGLKMSGTFQPRSLKNINIQGDFQPSASIQLAGSQYIDAFVARSGVKMVSTLHTSTSINGKVVIQGGKLVDVELNMPRDKIEILDVKNQFFHYEGDHEVPALSQKETKFEGCTGAPSLLGVKLCGSVSYPQTSYESPFFPLHGPVAAHVFLEKTDTHTSYIFQYKWERNAISLLLDTPNSKINRKISLDLSWIQKNLFDITILTPFKDIRALGDYSWSPKEKKVLLEVLMGQNKKYTLLSSLKKLADGTEVKYEPTLVITSPVGEIFNLEGSLLGNRVKNMYLTNISISKVFEKPLTFQAAIEGGSHKIDLQTLLESPLLDASFKGLYQVEDRSFNSNVDIEYTFPREAKHTIKSSILLKRERKNSSKSYSLDFQFKPSQFPTLHTELKAENSMAAGSLETKVELTRDYVVWTAEHSWLHHNIEGEKREFSSDFVIKCPAYNVDTLLSYNYLHNNEEFDTGVRFRVQEFLDFDYKIKANLINFEYKLFYSFKMPELEFTFEHNLEKIDQGHYKATISGNVLDNPLETEINIKDKSTPSSVDLAIDGQHEGLGYRAILDTALVANKDEANFDLLFNVNDKDYTVNAEASRTSLLLDVNIIRHISLDAKIVPTGDERSVAVTAFWDKDEDQSKRLHISGKISPTTFHGSLKYLDNEFSLGGKITDGKVQLQAQYAPNQIITSEVRYNLAEKKSFSIMVETPFTGYEKQEASVNFFARETELTSNIKATWKENQQFEFSVTGKYKGTLQSHNLMTEVVFASTFPGYENAKASLHHQLNGSVKSKLLADWNDDHTEGTFDLVLTDQEIKSTLTFKSPFTEDLFLSFRNHLSETNLAITSKIIYGLEDILNLSVKGHVDIVDKHEIIFDLDIDTYRQVIPKIASTVNYILEDSKITLLAEAIVDKSKMMLSINGVKTVMGDTTIIEGDLRFITPFTKPLTANITHTHNNIQFTSAFEMSRIWSTFGNIKVHAEGKMTSINQIALHVNIISPLIKSQFVISHKLIDSSLDSKCEISVNNHRTAITADGILDLTTKNVKLNISLQSTVDELHDFKLSFNHVRKGFNYETNGVLTKGSANFAIDHIILFNDAYNWENVLNINNNYIFKNKQSHVDAHIKHELEYTWLEKIVNSQVSVHFRREAPLDLYDLLFTLQTPFTNEIKVTLNSKINLQYANSVLTIEYGPENKIFASLTARVIENSASLEIVLETPFFVPVNFHLSTDTQEGKASTTTSLVWGDNEVALILKVGVIGNEVQCSAHLSTTYLEYPVQLEGSYDIDSVVKHFVLATTYSTTSRIEATLAGSQKEGKMSVSLEVPSFGINQVSLSTQHSFTNLPFIASAIITVNDHTYTVQGKVASDAINFTLDLDGKKGDLTVNWKYDPSLNTAMANASFKSPISNIDDLHLSVAYDIRKEKYVEIIMKRASQELKLRTELDGKRVVVKGSTPFSGWETIGASLLISDSAVNAYAFRNERKIEVTGNAHIKSGKGQITLTITTPYPAYEAISIETKYDLKGTNKKIDFNSAFGEKQLSFKTSANLEDFMAPTMMLDIVTPLEVFNHVSGQAKWNMKDKVKTVDIKTSRNEQTYHWTLSVTPENALKGHIVATITTPLPGWNSVTIEGKVDLTGPYSFVVVMDKDGVKDTYSFKFNFQNQAFTGELLTPIPSWEKMVLSGEYKLVDSEFTLDTTFSRNTNKYHLNVFTLLNKLTPKIEISTTTPIISASKLNLKLDANFANVEEKTIHISFKHDSSDYSLNFICKKGYKSCDMKLKVITPIIGYTSLVLAGHVDLTGDTKIAQFSLIKENEANKFFIGAEIVNNRFTITIKTPFEGYENINVIGDYTKANMKHSALAFFEKNESKYTINGLLNLGEKSFTLSTESPIDGYKSVKVSGFINAKHLEVVFLKEDKRYEITADYHFTPSSVSIKVKTPFQIISTVSLGGNYHFTNNKLEFSFMSELNGENIQLDAHADLSDLPMVLKANMVLVTPFNEWENLDINAQYDIISDVKRFGISVNKDHQIKKLNGEFSYSKKSGSFKIETPIQGFEAFGASYNLDLDQNNKKLEAFLKIYKNTQTWNFVARGQFTTDDVQIEFQTPFEGYDTIQFNAKIDTVGKTGEALLKFGPFTFTTGVTFKPGHITFKLTTPFRSLGVLSLDTKYNWNVQKKGAVLTVLYNDVSYQISTALLLTVPKSEITLSASLPFPGFEKTSFTAKYDVNSEDELLLIRVGLDKKSYGVSVGGALNEKNAKIAFNLETPVHGWELVHFNTNIDLAVDERNLVVFLEKNGEELIALSGKVIGSKIDFNLRSPLQGFKNVKMIGSLNRSKRSLEFQMMRDDSGVEAIISNFNSLKFDIKTPFANSKEITFEGSYIDGKIKVDWHRDENYFKLDITPGRGKSKFNVEVKGGFDGVQFLTVDGRLDRERFDAYLGAQINDELSTFRGSGQFSQNRAEMKVEVHSPYENYKTLNVDLQYNRMQKSFLISLVSDSSAFRFIIKGAMTRFSTDILFPHTEEPTIVNILLSPRNGHINIKSRYESLRSFNMNYEIKIGRVLEANCMVEKNGVKHFELEFKLDIEGELGHFKVHVNRGHHHSMFHLHHEKSHISITLSRDDKEMKIDVKRDDSNNPSTGEFYITIHDNIFHESHTMKSKLIFDLASDPKTLSLDFIPEEDVLYNFLLKYNHNEDSTTGDFTLRITTPDRSARLWKSIGGNWNVEDTNNASFTIQVGPIIYTGKGKVGLRETDLTFVPNMQGEKIYVQWKHYKHGNRRDTFFKFGREGDYIMFKLKGTIIDKDNLDIEAALGISQYMSDLIIKADWNKDENGVVTGRAQVTYKHIKVNITLEHYKYDALKKTVKFELSGNSNIPHFTNFKLKSNHDFNKKIVMQGELTHDEEKVSYDINFTDFNPEFSHNSASLHLAELGEAEMTIKHDFRNNNDKSIDAVLKFAGQESSTRAKWSRSDDFRTLNSNIAIKSVFIGDITIKADFDVRDFSNAHGEVYYSRNEDKHLSLVWNRHYNGEELKSDITFTSHFESIPNARVYIDGTFKKAIKFKGGIEFAEHKAQVDLKANKSKANVVVETSFENFEKITIDMEYSFTLKNKTLNVNYSRGDNKAHLEMKLDTREKTFDMKLTTPFEVISEVFIKANWSKDTATVLYRRNGVEYNFTGTANIKNEKSSFDLSFSPPGQAPLRIAAAYDVKNFISGKGKKMVDLAKIEMSFGDHNVKFHLKGARTNEHIHLHLEGMSSFAMVRNILVHLEGFQNPEKQEGTFEIGLNDYHLKVHSLYESRENNGYYLKSEIESSGNKVVIGLGRENGEQILTIGYGPDVEITFSIKPKSGGYMEGYSGKISLPKQGYHDMEYEVEHGFKSENEFFVNIEVDVGNDQDVEAHFVYNSDGIEARLKSLLTGEHRLRAKRSLSSTSFFTELGYNDYQLNLRGGFPEDSTKRGFVLEGELFGRKVKLDTLFQSQGMEYVEGKIELETTFKGFEHIGFRFTGANKNKILGRAEILLPSYNIPRITAEIDLETNKRIYGHVNIDVAGHVFRIKTDIQGSSITTGYTGSVEVRTPFFSFSEVDLTGSIRAQTFKFVEANFKILSPYSAHEFKVKYEITKTGATGTAIVDSSCLPQYYELGVSAAFSPFRIQISLNNNKIIGQYEKTDSKVVASLDVHSTFLAKKHASLKVEAILKTLTNMEGKITVDVESHTHQIEGALKVENQHIKGNVLLSSSLIEGVHKVEADVVVPTAPYDRIAIKFTYTSKEVYTFLFNLNLESGVKFNIEVKVPDSPKRTFAFVLKKNEASFVIATSQGTHKANVSWRIPSKMPANYVLHFEASSPFLTSGFEFNSEGSVSPDFVKILVEVTVAGVNHKLEGNITVKEKEISLSCKILTSIMNINNIIVKSHLDFTDKVIADLEVTVSHKVNKVNLLFDRNIKELQLSVESPYLPNDIVKAQATLDGENKNDLKLKLTLMDSMNTLSGVLKFKRKSENDISTALKILTPFKGYKKMTFGANYLKTNVSRIQVFSDSQSPFKFNVDTTFGNKDDEFRADVSVETPIEGFDKIGFTFLIPLNRFQPHLSLQLPDKTFGVDLHYIDKDEIVRSGAILTLGESYKHGYEFKLRKTLPFEITQKRYLGDKSTAFHLRTDSSFLRLVTPYA